MQEKTLHFVCIIFSILSLLLMVQMYPANSTNRFSWLTRSTSIFVVGECSDIYIYSVLLLTNTITHEI